MAEGSTVPPVDDVEKLPLWAQVALAARCARRTLPLCYAHWTELPADCRLRLERALDFAELAAAAGEERDAVRSEATALANDVAVLATTAATRIGHADADQLPAARAAKEA